MALTPALREAMPVELLRWFKEDLMLPVCEAVLGLNFYGLLELNRFLTKS